MTIDFSDRIVDVVRENYDFVIRVANLPDSSLVARKLCTTQHVFCASPDYLASRPSITTLTDLQGHRILQFGNSKRFSWSAKNRSGKNETVSLRASHNSDDGAFLVDAAVQSLGITRLPDFLVESVLKTGKLVRILDQFRPDPLGIYAVYPATLYLPARTRVFLNFLVSQLSDKSRLLASPSRAITD